MNFIVKRATVDDIANVSSLFNKYRVFYKQEPDLALASGFISERINNDESVIFIASNANGEPLGFTQLYPIFSSVSASRSWVLNDLYVSSEARGMGVGKSLMEAAKQHALESGANGIALETAQDNSTAQALYEALGYKRSNGFYSYFLSIK